MKKIELFDTFDTIEVYRCNPPVSELFFSPDTAKGFYIHSSNKKNLYTNNGRDLTEDEYSIVMAVNGFDRAVHLDATYYINTCRMVLVEKKSKVIIFYYIS